MFSCGFQPKAENYHIVSSRCVYQSYMTKKRNCKCSCYSESWVTTVKLQSYLVYGRKYVLQEELDSLLNPLNIRQMPYFLILTRCIGSDFRFLTKGPTLCCDSGCVYLPS